MISEKSVQEILETARIEEVVQDFVTLKRRGVNLIGLCPFHTEKTPSFNVSPARNIYKCFGCGKGGDAANFLMEHEQFSFPEALRYLANKYGIAIEETQTEKTPEELQQQQYLDSLYLLNQFAATFYQEQLFETDRGKSVGLNYFRERGFREETIRKFGLGMAPREKDALTTAALNTGYAKDLLEKLRLTNQYGGDFFRNRVMFPIHNLSGKVIAFAGRLLQKDAKAPKYINSPETEIYHKSKVLYGTHLAKRAIRQQDECILVEGYTDVISLHQAGIENVVASSGTALTSEQIRLIKRYSQNIKILYDGDPAGLKAALRGLDMVLEQDLNVSVVVLPEGEDPDSYVRNAGTTAFKEYLQEKSKDFILFKVELLLQDAGDDPVRKTAAIKDIVSSIARVADPLKRSLFVKECARLVEVEEQLLVNETNKLLSRRLKSQHQEEPASAFPQQEDTLSPPAGRQAQVTREDVAGDTFQEKDILRILITHGEKHYDEDENYTVAEYLLTNIEDVIDYFDNPWYGKIIRDCMARLQRQEPLGTQYFLHHPDEKVRQLAIDFISSPYAYSDNWANKWDIFLSQKMPDENQKKDAMDGIKKFKLRKIRKLIAENTAKLQHLSPDDEEVSTILKVHLHLKTMESKLARELGMVVLRH